MAERLLQQTVQAEMTFVQTRGRIAGKYVIHEINSSSFFNIAHIPCVTRTRIIIINTNNFQSINLEYHNYIRSMESI